MKLFSQIKSGKSARIGLYTIGHSHYWNQFAGLRDRLVQYGKFIEKQMSVWGEVYNFGMVDSVEQARMAGEWFNQQNVDILFCHAGTYAMSANHLPIPQICKRPIVLLNLQPALQVNYESSTTGEWLAHCGACGVPETVNAFTRAHVPVHIVSGLLGLSETPSISMTDEVTHGHPDAVHAWEEIHDWIRAAEVTRTLQNSRFGFLGHTYPGMLDMYSDFTMIQGKTGLHVEILEMCDLDQIVPTVTDKEKRLKRQQVEEMFILSEDSLADPLARRPTEEQLDWACTVAVAQEKLVRAFDLDALAYYYRGVPGNNYERLQEAFILGHSLLTAQGIPCSGEGDMKTALAMKICDLLNVGGSFSEIVVADFAEQTILVGHDGPFHLSIADSKPILRGMGLYHGKWGSGVSVEAKVKSGPVTTLGITQDGEQLKMIVNEAEATNGPIMHIGNTMTPVRFPFGPSEMMNRWFRLSPTHHFALSVGHNAKVFHKVASLLDMEFYIGTESST